MTIDIERYSVQKKFIQDLYLSRYVGEPSRAIGHIASATMVPAIVVASYIGEIDGWSEELTKSIKTLQDFYGYTTIENKPAGFPI